MAFSYIHYYAWLFFLSLPSAFSHSSVQLLLVPFLPQSSLLSAFGSYTHTHTPYFLISILSCDFVLPFYNPLSIFMICMSVWTHTYTHLDTTYERENIICLSGSCLFYWIWCFSVLSIFLQMLFFYDQIKFHCVCVYTTFFMHSSMDEHLNCFHFFSKIYLLVWCLGVTRYGCK